MNIILPTKILRRMSLQDRKALKKAGMLPEECAAKNNLKREKDFQAEIASVLRRRGIWFNVDATHKRRYGTKGLPDFIFAVNGLACAIEAKRPGEKPREDQLRCHEQMKQNGWKVIVVTSLREVIDFLDEEEILKGNLK